MRIVRRPACIVLGLTLLTSLAAAEDLVEDTRYYDVTGETPAEIWQEMKAHGPVGKDGVRYNGNTKWSVRWRYPYARSAEGCATGPVAVRLSVVYTLPRWDRPRGASTELESQWERFIEALDEHEQGHAEFGRQAAREIKQALEAIPARSSCESLSRIANATGAEILELTRPQEREYDRRTNHGATQGTAFFRELARGRTTSRH